MDRRDEVIASVCGNYGNSSFGQIATFHSPKSKSVGRVLGMTLVDADRIASFVPEPVQGEVVPIAEAMKQRSRQIAIARGNPTPPSTNTLEADAVRESVGGQPDSSR
jgi:DNA polymerase III alpha subunit